jgi:hypothetical protein
MMSQMGEIEIADPTIMQMHALELKPRTSAFLPLHRPTKLQRKFRPSALFSINHSTAL